MKKRLTAWLLTLSMLLTVLSPLSALAAEDFDEDVNEQYPEELVSADDVDDPDSSDEISAYSAYSSDEIATFSTGLSLAELRAKFPAGKYWNHAGALGNSSAVNNQDGWTDTPCPTNHQSTVKTSQQTCNAFAPNGAPLSYQCMGYAEKLGYDATGYNPRNNAHGWSTSEDTSALDHLKPGDIVRFQNGRYPHSIYITAVNGDTVTYTDCNGSGSCRIRWDVTKSISSLRSTLIHVRSAPFAMSGGTSNHLPEGSLDNCEGGAGSIYVRGWSFDWDNWGAYIAIHVYIDGVGTEIIANTSRPDVQNVYPGVGPNHGFEAKIPASAGTHTVTVYAIDNEDPSQHSVLGEQTVTVSAVSSDTTGPEFSNCSVTKTDADGYTISCTITDPSGVDRVVFETWTTAEGRANSRQESGTRNGNTYTYRVKKSDHGNATSGYMTYIFAYDKYGNWSGRKLSHEWSLPVVATGIKANPETSTLSGLNKTVKLSANVMPSNTTDKTVTWSSSNTSVATVSADGEVKSVGYGTAVITAKTANGLTSKCTITVKDTEAPVFTDGSPHILNVDSFGYTVFCGVMDNDQISKIVFRTWTEAEGEKNATVYTYTGTKSLVSHRELKADHHGATSGYTTRVEAYDRSGNMSYRIARNISIPVGVDKVNLSTTNMTLAVGGKQTITATVTPADAVNHTIQWSSSNTSVATVSDQGVVSAVGYGTATITATASNGVKAICTVNVVQESLTGISVASKPSKTSYHVGDTLDVSGLTLKAAYNNGTVKTISSGFTCTPTKLDTVGTQTITVNYSGKTASFTVTVGKYAQNAPTGLQGVAATSATAADGKITGTTSAMEWAAKGSSTYTPCADGSVTGLAPGTYLVRYAQTTTQDAGAATEVTVPAHTVDYQAITLTFDPTDGTLDVTDDPTKTVYIGETYGRLPEPTATGYVFTGWYTASGTQITAQTTCDLTQDATVSARWEPASAPGYSFDQRTGTLTIDCSGAMEDYLSAADTPWYSYRASIRSIVVKNGVTSLSSYAFAGCENLSSVSLPDTLRSIGTMAFYDCDQLTSIVIPASVRTIGAYAFADDGGLSTVTFQGDAPAFGTGVFTVGALEAFYPVYASGWESVVKQNYGFGGSIQWTRSSDTAEQSTFMDDALPEEPEWYEDASLAPDWTL